MNRARQERLQIMLTPEERKAIDDWRFERRMPSRAAAVRELLRRGLAADGFVIASDTARSGEFGVLGNDSVTVDRGNGGNGRHDGRGRGR